ncbi:Putative multidrug export ATP-binding/permease protein [Myxococcaceae bacterium]|nr:Putative multidrug export ATP-binding/permease protein [Myxococcaceae bacterium]
MSAGSEPDAERESLRRLGAGGASDRLHFRLVVGLLVRCLRLVGPVKAHVLRLVVGFAAIAIVLAPIGFLLFDLFWTRVLQGQPLTSIEATLLSFDPARTVHVAALDEALRRSVAVRTIVLGVAVGVVSMPIFLGLWYYQVWILQRINQVLRVELVQRLTSLSLRFHAESRVGDAIYRLYQDSAMVTQLIDVLFLTPLGAAARFLFSIGLVFCFDPKLAAILAAVWPPTLAIGFLVSRTLRVRFRAARESNSHLTSTIQETLAGIRVLKAYGAEGRAQQRFEERSEQAFARAFEARSLLARFGMQIFWIVGVALLAATALAALETRTGAPLFAERLLAAFGFTAWNLGLFNNLKLHFGGGTDQVRRLFSTWGRVQDVAIGLDRVFELLDTTPDVQDAADARPLESVHRSIAYRDVSFRYRPDRLVLDGVSLEARVGTITAIVGPTGSGKSTLMALLLRLFDPERGRIEIDGHDIRDFTLESLRSKISIALQENLLFGTTVRENVRYAVPQASNAAVEAAARVACAHEFIERLPEGYDTLLGERGTKLSTGQRQRLSIARALVKDTPILILDEPTASLDADTEMRVLANLAEWGRGRAIFLITHRLSTIRRADHIVYVAEGRIVEGGSHEELVAREGSAYRRLVEVETAQVAAGGLR